jgi:hypothetical protein
LKNPDPGCSIPGGILNKYGIFSAEKPVQNQVSSNPRGCVIIYVFSRQDNCNPNIQLKIPSHGGPTLPEFTGESAMAELLLVTALIPILVFVLSVFIIIPGIRRIVARRKSKHIERLEIKKDKPAIISPNADKNGRIIAAADLLIQLGKQEIALPSPTSLWNPEVLSNKLLLKSTPSSENPGFQSTSNGEFTSKSSRETQREATEHSTKIVTKIADEANEESSFQINTPDRTGKSELFLEIKDNLATANISRSGQLLPFQTATWDRSLYEIDSLPIDTLKELKEAYIDIRLANELVWLSEAVGKTGREMEESYLKLRNSIAQRLDRVMIQIKDMPGFDIL